MRLILPFLLLPLICFGNTIVQTFDAPDTGITGLAWGDDVLWAVDGTTQYVYGIDPATGSVNTSFYAMDQTSTYNPVPGGLTYANSNIQLAMHSGTQYGKIYRYDDSGAYVGMYDVYC